MKKIFCIFILVFSSLKVLIAAPVDYSEEVKEKKKTKKKGKKPSQLSPVVRRPETSLRGSWVFETSLETIDVDSFSPQEKTSLYKLNVYYKPRPDFYFKVSQFYGASNDINLNGAFSKKGNLEVRLVANWLRWSNGEYDTKLDIFGGVSIKERNSNFASSRNDKIVGFETARNFSNFIFSLGHELRLTSTPKDKAEMAIGDIRKYYAIFGWKVTSDINFAVEAVQHNIRPSNNEGLALKDKVVSGYLSPWLFLNLSARYDIIMGGVFRTNRIKNREELIKARLWSFQGLYGNSIFAKINVNI